MNPANQTGRMKDQHGSMKDLVVRSLRSASQSLGTRDPLPYVGGLIDRTFYGPDDDVAYSHNALTPGAVPY